MDFRENWAEAQKVSSHFPNIIPNYLKLNNFFFRQYLKKNFSNIFSKILNISTFYVILNKIYLNFT